VKNTPIELLPLRSPLRFPGGKIRAAKKFLLHVPEHVAYREPLCGGAALFFRKPKVKWNWLNDSHPGVYAFLTSLRDDFEQFRELLKRIVVRTGSEARQRVHLRRVFDRLKARRGLMTSTTDADITPRGLQYYVLNRLVWGGRVVYDPARACRLYFSNPEGFDNLERKLETLRLCSRKLQGVKITCIDFAKCFTGLSKKRRTFIYLDPPYMRDTAAPKMDKLYDHTFSEKDHEQLRKAVERASHGRADVMLSYGDCPKVRRLYRGYQFINLKWKYAGRQAVTRKMKQAGQKETKVTGDELLILNYSF